jgi:hypothetical protein
VRWGEAVRDRGRLAPVWRAELVQDVRDVDAGRPDADHEYRRDLAVGVATGEEIQDLRLPRGQAKDFLEALFSVGRPRVRRCELQPRALGEQLEPFSKGLCSDPGRDGVGLPERPARLGAGGAGGDECLGLAPAAVVLRSLDPVGEGVTSVAWGWW